jgi:hypothetical protein
MLVIKVRPFANGAGELPEPKESMTAGVFSR